MMSVAPQVTIGMPVFNGAAHLRQAVESLLTQTFQNYQVLICDNASTDDSAAIAQSLAAQDHRVLVHRHERNLGAVANFLFAAERANTPYFCWAAHDDLRQPAFLQTLIAALEANRHAGLACCAVWNLDPDGAQREIRPETKALCGIEHKSPTDRLLSYLRECPGTPFYGLFRTEMLWPALDVLRRTRVDHSAPPLGLDMIFLAAFIRAHPIVFVDQPLLEFRRGGFSHRLDSYRTLRSYVAQIGRFCRELRNVCVDDLQTMVERLRLRVARTRFVFRFMLSQPMRRMTWHYLAHAFPSLRWLRNRCLARVNPGITRLRSRLRNAPQIRRIAIFGAGKHTRENIGVLRAALGRHTTICAIADDRATECDPIDQFEIVHPARVVEFAPDMILVSSDTYEMTLFRRAREFAPPSCAVWCLYDTMLESSDIKPSSRSTSARNDIMLAIAPSPGGVCQQPLAS